MTTARLSRDEEYPEPRAILVTAADERFARSLAQMLLSVRRTRQDRVFKVLVYDLGLADRTRRELARLFAFAEFRPFDFARCRPFPGDPARCRSTYAWKPAIVAELMQTATVPIIWADSATVLVQSLEPVLSWIRATGLYTPRAGCGAIELRTHPDTLRLLQAPASVRAERQVAGAFLGLDPNSPLAQRIAGNGRSGPPTRPVWRRRVRIPTTIATTRPSSACWC